jgi:Family of unknown function (DUF5338)
MAGSKTRSEKGVPRVAFRAKRSEIADALERGETVKAVWVRLFATEGKPAISYRNFVVLVWAEIRGVPRPSRSRKSGPAVGRAEESGAKCGRWFCVG